MSFGPRPNNDGERVLRIDGRSPCSVITGATEGLGRAYVDELAALGHDLVLIARSEAKLIEVKEACAQIFGNRIFCLPLDLTVKNSHQILQDCLDENGLYLDILINSAGNGVAGPFVENDPAVLEALVALNVESLTRFNRHFLPGMIARRGGGILNIASLAGMVPGPNQAAYYASKAYVISLTEALSREIAGSRVHMSVVASGPINTEFHNKAGSQNSLYLTFLGRMSAKSVARSSLRSYMYRKTVIVPGVISFFTSLMLQFVPHFITVPITGWLLKIR